MYLFQNFQIQLLELINKLNARIYEEKIVAILECKYSELASYTEVQVEVLLILVELV